MLSSLSFALTFLLALSILTIFATAHAQGGVDSYMSSGVNLYVDDRNPSKGYGNGWLEFYERGFGCAPSHLAKGLGRFWFNDTGSCFDIEGHPQSDIKIFFGTIDHLNFTAVDFFVKDAGSGCQMADQVAHCAPGQSCLGSAPNLLVEDAQNHWCYAYNENDSGSTKMWLSYMTWPSDTAVDILHQKKIEVPGYDTPPNA